MHRAQEGGASKRPIEIDRCVHNYWLLLSPHTMSHASLTKQFARAIDQRGIHGSTSTIGKLIYDGQNCCTLVQNCCILVQNRHTVDSREEDAGRRGCADVGDVGWSGMLDSSGTPATACTVERRRRFSASAREWKFSLLCVDGLDWPQRVRIGFS
jgi:hypothetical protein